MGDGGGFGGTDSDGRVGLGVARMEGAIILLNDRRPQGATLQIIYKLTTTDTR
jgi:hypothetical protein